MLESFGLREPKVYRISGQIKSLPFCCGILEAGHFTYDTFPGYYDYLTHSGENKQEVIIAFLRRLRMIKPFRKQEKGLPRTHPVVLNLVNHEPVCRDIRKVLVNTPDAVLVHTWYNGNYSRGHKIEMWMLKNDGTATEATE